jgi:hypothetical protein
MFLVDFEKEKDVSEIARQALLNEKAYNTQNKPVNLLYEVSQKIKSADYAKNLYLPYDENVFEGKVAIDLLYYKHLLRNLDESYYKDVHELLAQTYRSVKDIYEFVNIKPETFGKGIDNSILENSIEDVSKKLNVVLNEVLDSTFYNLTPDQRSRKYSDRALPLAKRLITEHNDPEESLQYSIKTCVLEDVLTKIAFPGSNWLRVKHLTESEDFGLIFDQQKLVGIVENFEKQINRLSKYLAACV